MKTMLQKRSLSLSGHRTSLALEAEFWAVLDQAAEEQRLSLAALIGRIDEARVEAGDDLNLASACRVWALKRVQARD
ncbi:MAG: aryl-sulfate sulfotransferase [Maricaulis sp.]|jgi:predicted DNA-binding ribbon-helix-helix protein|nr:aryl-sulfate sulfotransferase [Maricaulis sp.]HAQ35702.1 aryl-sulfate sulfotransferase [Alphaproteobacteria bacterium]|tara:strand:- start:324 stop:554 length:231 start_codon:yes stop_codon:yes gene_type:complete